MKKGFTLIELLAVIVILAIIALIATPIILGIINDAREESNERSVELYASAVRNGIAAYQLTNGEVPAGTYSLTADKTSLTNGTVTFDVDYDGNVECTSIIISDDSKVSLEGCTVNGGEKQYSYGIEDDSVAKVCSIEQHDPNKYSIGDEITCILGEDEDKFYIIEEAASTTTSVFALTEYALDLTTYKQSTTAGTITYAEDPYWCDAEGKLKSEYSTGDVYDRNSNLYPIIEGYVSYLKSNGLNEITGGLITSSQRSELAGNTSSFGVHKEFWTDYATCSGLSTYPGSEVPVFADKGFMFSDSNGFYTASYQYGMGNEPYSFVVRPVITISTSHIQ